MNNHPRDQEIEAVFAIVVTSDTRTLETDETGKLAIQILEEAGHKIAAYNIVENNEKKITGVLRGLLKDKRVQIIITSGGTGISPRDKTVDAAKGLFERVIPGFGEAFRRLSYNEIGGPAMISRGIAGISEGKLIFCLPGSKGAIVTGLEKLILPTVGHMIWELSRH